jgi:hypothetical protein
VAYQQADHWGFHLMRNRLPLIISITALVVAVLGTTPLGQAAYNAVVPTNSVGALQLRPGAVTEAKLRGDAVTSGKVKNRSLKSIDFAEGQIPAGPAGAKGDKGDKGDKGTKGDIGAPGLSGYQIVSTSPSRRLASTLRRSIVQPARRRWAADL